MVRAAWLSANVFGYELLKEAVKVKNFDIQVIFTLSKNSKTLMYDPMELKKWHEFGIPVCEISNINEEISLVQSYSVDLIIMCGWRQIIRHDLIRSVPKGIIGFHPTRLPYGRGPAPIINTILEGITDSAVTMYFISTGLDDGDIIGQEPFIVEPDDYAQDIYDKVICSGKNLINTYLPQIVKGNAPRIPQNTRDATYFQKRSMIDNQINLDLDPLDLVYRKIRAFSRPYNGAYIEKGNKKLIIWRAEIGENP